MRKMTRVMIYEIGTTLQRKSFVIMALGLPLILGIVALVVGSLGQGTPPSAAEPVPDDVPAVLPEGYVDAGGIIQHLPDDVPPEMLVAYADEASALEALEAGVIDGYYLIPADYVETGEVVLVREAYDPTSQRSLFDTLEWVLMNNLLGDADLAINVQHPLVVRETVLPSDDPTSGQEGWIVELFPTIMVLILYMVILMPAGLLVNAITDEKKNYVMEVLLSSMSPLQMITGKIVALGLLGLLQTTLWVGIFWAVTSFGGSALDIPPGFEIPKQMLVWAFVYGLLGYAIYGAQMAGVGALAPEMREAQGATMIIMAPLILAYILAMVIQEAPNEPLSVGMSLFPLTSPVAMIARMTRTAVPVWQAVLAAGLQLVTAVFIVRLAARLFHAQHLLSGQPFSARRYYRLLVGRT